MKLICLCFRKKLKEYPHIFTKKSAFVDTMFWVCVTSNFGLNSNFFNNKSYDIYHYLIYVFFIYVVKCSSKMNWTCQKWKEFKVPKNDILVNYDKGYQPLHFFPWSDIDIVYVPIHIRTTHWVLGVVHLAQIYIYIYFVFVYMYMYTYSVCLYILCIMCMPIYIVYCVCVFCACLYILCMVCAWHKQWSKIASISYFGVRGDSKANNREWRIERLKYFPQ